MNSNLITPAFLPYFPLEIPLSPPLGEKTPLSLQVHALSHNLNLMADFFLGDFPSALTQKHRLSFPYIYFLEKPSRDVL
jgi:hypothetical protein